MGLGELLVAHCHLQHSAGLYERPAHSGAGWRSCAVHAVRDDQRAEAKRQVHGIFPTGGHDPALWPHGLRNGPGYLPVVQVVRKPMRSIFLLYCLVYFAARGQGGAATIKPHIDNNKTAAHVRVPGTRLFLIPPPHFTLSSWYSGFEKKEVAAIVVIDQPGGSYAASAGSFTKAELESRGVKVLDFRDLTINGFPARFAEVKGPGASKVFELVFGDPTFAAMVTASNKAGDDATGAALIGSLNSIVYDKKVKTDPFELAHFSVGSNTSVFKFFRSNGNMFIYSVGGADRSRDANAPVVLITQVPTQGALSPKSVVGQILQQEVRNGLS